MTLPFMTFDEVNPKLNWLDLIQDLKEGHLLPKAQVQDVFMNHATKNILSRHAWIEGLGIAVKTATIFPENTQNSKINGLLTLYSHSNGLPEALIDFKLVTKWKTAGDSLLAASKLARPTSRHILINGAGDVAESLIEAYSALFPNAVFTICNRTKERAQKLVQKMSKLYNVKLGDTLKYEVSNADIIASATMTERPLFDGDWFKPGQHIDLIGAYKPNMREVDDKTLTRSAIFVDSKDTTIDHIGELKIPISTGAIKQSDIIADFYDESNGYCRTSDQEITLFKNGGGAHLDLMTGIYLSLIHF